MIDPRLEASADAATREPISRAASHNDMLIARIKGIRPTRSFGLRDPRDPNVPSAPTPANE